MKSNPAKHEVFYHRLNGVSYKIEILGDVCHRTVDGLCTPPDDKKPHIFIMRSLATKKGLAVLLHEIFHPQNWGLPEDEIERIANESTELLWKLGYRRQQRKRKARR